MWASGTGEGGPAGGLRWRPPEDAGAAPRRPGRPGGEAPHLLRSRVGQGPPGLPGRGRQVQGPDGRAGEKRGDNLLPWPLGPVHTRVKYFPHIDVLYVLKVSGDVARARKMSVFI